MAISREIWGNDMIVVRKQGNQISEHMRRGRKAVQEQNRGSIWRTGFAIEDFQPLQAKRAIENGRCNRFDFGWRKCLLEKVAVSGLS